MRYKYRFSILIFSPEGLQLSFSFNKHSHQMNLLKLLQNHWCPAVFLVCPGELKWMASLVDMIGSVGQIRFLLNILLGVLRETVAWKMYVCLENSRVKNLRARARNRLPYHPPIPRLFLQISLREIHPINRQERLRINHLGLLQINLRVRLQINHLGHLPISLRECLPINHREPLLISLLVRLLTSHRRFHRKWCVHYEWWRNCGSLCKSFSNSLIQYFVLFLRFHLP